MYIYICISKFHDQTCARACRLATMAMVKNIKLIMYITIKIKVIFHSHIITDKCLQRDTWIDT